MKVKSLNNFFISFLLLFSVLGCIPEPLPVDDLPKAQVKIVVSSQIVPETGLVIFLSRSLGALDAGDGTDIEELLEAIIIDDALVTIAVDGDTDTLENIGDGFYGEFNPEWRTDTDYTLQVISPSLGSVQAVTRVQQSIPFSEVSARIYSNEFDSLAQITYRLNDPEGENFYMLNVQRFSDLELSNYINPRIYTRLIEDKNFDGRQVSEIFNVPFQEFSMGDTIAVSMANISEDYYKFLKVRADNRFSFVDFAGEPLNYPTNVQGGYGFFNLHTPDIRVFILN